MVRYLRLIVVVAAALIAVPVARGAVPGQGCAGPPTVSALNQYCENIPAATGARPPLPGSPALATVLPHGIARRILKSAPDSARRKLLRLPAGARPIPPHGAGAADPWSLSLPLVVMLLLVGLGLTATAAARRRRRPRPA